MLSRVANSLYWTGRYIERSDLLGRFLNINYFSSLDTPNTMTASRKMVLESLLLMGGYDYDGVLEEEPILFHLGFDKQNPNSIITSVTKARQNAHGTRHILSTDVWEAINKGYHFVNTYPVHVFVRTGLYDLTTKLNEACSVIREKIIRTLLHDEVYALLMLGIHMERAFQIVRLINIKMFDIQKLLLEDSVSVDIEHEWATLLRCAEVYDMSKKHYKKIPNKLKTIEFLLFNPQNPKSLLNNIEKSKDYIDQISNRTKVPPDCAEFKIGKMLANFSYLTIDDVEKDISAFLTDTFDQLLDIGQTFEEDYLSYHVANP